MRDVALGASGGDAAANGHAALMCTGALTGAIGAFVFNPVDVVRVQMQVERCAYASTHRAFGRVARREGVAAPGRA